MKFTVTTQALDRVKADALIVLHEQGGLLAETKNKGLAKHLENYARDVEAGRSKREWFCTLEKEIKAATRHLLLDSSTHGAYAPHDEPLKVAAARCVALCRQYSLKRLAFAVHHKVAPEKAAAILEGAMIGDFSDQRYKGQDKTKRPEMNIQFVVAKKQEKETREELARVQAITESVNSARELVNAPHHELTPEGMTRYAKSLAKRYGLKTTVLNEKQLKEEGFLPTYEVGRGSEYPPRMIVLRYTPKHTRVREHLALVGKGITFDSGGLSIKTRATMYKMNYDMGGAAVVLGAMEAIARLELPVKVTAVIGSAHNAVDGAAYHPGSIIRARNGKTIHVENTDAEGRLVLTDCLFKAGEEKADVIWDFATLTGSVAAALGPAYAGLFTDDDQLRTTLIEAGQNSGDELWPLPLAREYEASLKHYLADLNNVSTEKTAGGIHAANFLKQFVPEGTLWAHIDVAGVAFAEGRRRYYTKGATGFGVRLVLEALRLMTQES